MPKKTNPKPSKDEISAETENQRFSLDKTDELKETKVEKKGRLLKGSDEAKEYMKILREKKRLKSENKQS